MSSATDAPRVIRAGARIAARLGARWHAVYVETPREAPGRIRPQNRDALQHNIALAEELRAAIVRVKADRPADGLIALAKREGITPVVFGQTARTRWEILMKGYTLNRFLEEVDDAPSRSYRWEMPVNERGLTTFLSTLYESLMEGALNIGECRTAARRQLAQLSSAWPVQPRHSASSHWPQST